MNYLLHIFIMINIYSILALSLNLLVGYAGLLSLSHAAFYGIGAYIGTLSIMNLGIPFLPSVLLAVGGSVLLSFIISIPSLRLKGDYFVLGSIGFQIIAFSILYNWVGLTRGPYGIPGIPRPSFFGLTIDSIPAFFIFSLLMAFLCAVLIYIITYSPFGRLLKAIREDETAAEALGKNVTRCKITAFALAAGFAAVSGVLFAGYMRYIDPTSFTMMESVYILSIIIIGGTGNLSGPITGVVLMIFLPEILRFLQIPDTIAANMRQIIYGLLLIVILRYWPQGLLGDHKLK